MTAGQRAVLAALTDGPKTVRQLAAGSTLGTTRSRIRRLEDQNLVRRAFQGNHHAIHWELTHAGRNALNLTT